MAYTISVFRRTDPCGCCEDGDKAYVVAVKASDVTGVDPEVVAQHIEELEAAVPNHRGKALPCDNFDEVARFYDEIDTIEKDKIVINAVSKKRNFHLPHNSKPVSAPCGCFY